MAFALLNIAVLVSGFGTNLQAIIDSIANGALQGVSIGIVISDRKHAYALTRAQKHGIQASFIPKQDTAALLQALKTSAVDGLVLAGYLSILPKEVIASYAQKIINIHPSLIPAYCGKGFYGIKVHEAVLSASETETGATVHLVDNGIDTGPILLQRRVPVLPLDTPERLQQRVLQAEHALLAEALQTWSAQGMSAFFQNPTA